MQACWKATDFGCELLDCDRHLVLPQRWRCLKSCVSSRSDWGCATSTRPLDGVVRVMVKVPLKQVIVDHEAGVVSAAEINEVLVQEDFGSTILQDGAIKPDASNPTTVGRSRFYVEKICCASEIPAIQSIVEPLDGVVNVRVNVTTKQVYVDHEMEPEKKVSKD